jgi:hypothetical protein
MALPPKNGEHMILGCPTAFGGNTDRSKCNLKWNSTAVKVIVHVTDEDSDMPTNPLYQMKNQKNESGCSFQYDSNGSPRNTSFIFEPLFKPRSLLVAASSIGKYLRTQSNLTLEKSFQDEINLTAYLASSSDVLLVSLIALKGTEHSVSAFNSENSYYFKTNYISKNLIPDKVTVTTSQFGHPYFQSQTKYFTNFSIPKTIKNLVENGFKNSLQAQVLSKEV